MDRAEYRYEQRRIAFQRLRKGFEKNVEFADALGEGFAPSYVSQLLSGHRNIGDDVATKIEERLKLQPLSLDQPTNITELPARSDPDIAAVIRAMEGMSCDSKNSVRVFAEMIAATQTKAGTANSGK